MPTHERTRRTTATRQRIWSIWSDPTTWPRWNPDVRTITLDGPFQSGTTGTMTTGSRTHAIRLENVTPGHSFDLVTAPLPGATFRFHCTVADDGDGSRISQAIAMSGPLAPLFSRLMGRRIAQSFDPILAGLAQAAESAER